MSKRTIATVALTTIALSAGGFGTANAATKSTRTVVTKSITKFSHTSDEARGFGVQVAALEGILSNLVAKGTITADQAKAIKAAVLAAAQTAKANREAKIGGPDRTAIETLISSTIGLDKAIIKSRLKAGESLATIAGEKKDALIAALVAEFSKRIDAKFAEGKISAAQATTRKTNLLAQVTAEVNRVKGKRGHFGFTGAPFLQDTHTN